MDLGVLILIGGGFIFFLVFLPLALLYERRLKKRYGPKEQLPGPPRVRGTLVCKTWKAPTIGKKPTFVYKLNLSAAGDDLTGKYRYPPQTERKKPIYSGEVFLTYLQGYVKGRSDNKVVEGKLSPTQADLRLGFAKGSLLSFLNTPFRFSIAGERLRFFSNRGGRQDSIHPRSQLNIAKNKISGQLGYYPNETWLIEVDVAYRGVPPELVTLALLMVSNDIFELHHQ